MHSVHAFVCTVCMHVISICRYFVCALYMCMCVFELRVFYTG